MAKRHARLPVLRPNEAMIAEAQAHVQAHGGRIGLLATFAPTLQSMPAEFESGIEVRTALAKGALLALQQGDPKQHDDIVCAAAEQLVGDGCTIIALAQFSLARARAAVAERTGLPVLTTVDSAVARLRQSLAT